MTPIEKNIIVVDEKGNEYEATYPKRAKGLVKAGRARFIDENKICLACPPDIYLEDNNMRENTINVKNESIYNIEFILNQIAKLQDQTEYLNTTLEKLSELGDGDSGGPGAPGNILGMEKAKAIGDVVRCRETTNQQLLAFYEKIYDDLRPVNDAAKTSILDKLTEIAANADEFGSVKSDMLDTVRQIMKENFNN